LTINDAVAYRTIKLLKEKNITQYRLGVNAGILQSTLDRVLSGKNNTVTFTTVYKIARGFNMTISEFLDDDIFNSEKLEID